MLNVSTKYLGVKNALFVNISVESLVYMFGWWCKTGNTCDNFTKKVVQLQSPFSTAHTIYSNSIMYVLQLFVNQNPGFR